MTECPILTDLKIQRMQLRNGLKSIRHDLSLCAACKNKCVSYQEVKRDIELGIQDALKEIQSNAA